MQLLADNATGQIQELNFEHIGRFALDMASTNVHEARPLLPLDDYPLWRTLLATCAAKKSSHTRQDVKKSHFRRNRYRPHVTIKNARLRLKIVQMGKRFELVDRGFAESFQAVGRGADPAVLSKLLGDARASAISRHAPGCSYIGDLGEFCETVLGTWELSDNKTDWIEYKPSREREEDYVHYLQDTLELPYWDFMITTFMKWRRLAPDHIGGKSILLTLNYITSNCRKRLKTLLAEASVGDPEDYEAVKVVAEGVVERIRALECIFHVHTVDPDDLDDDDDVICTLRKEKPYEADFPRVQGHGTGRDGLEAQEVTVTLIATIFIFIVFAIFLGYKGFALSMRENGIGSTLDADFWYTCQGNTMSVLGSPATAMTGHSQLQKKQVRNTFWVLFTAVILSAIVSSAVYVCWNTGYSATVSFFGSVASIWSVLVLMHAPAIATATSTESSEDDKIKEKEKKD
ncbi:hypothetical protein F4810DRAFT_655922 [Camillea tinctor]|nr:hypothetical protein F4810DRAFT_655922 [Camillea tinctor]